MSKSIRPLLSRVPDVKEKSHVASYESLFPITSVEDLALKIPTLFPNSPPLSAKDNMGSGLPFGHPPPKKK